MRRVADSKTQSSQPAARAPEDVAKMRTRAGLKDITNSMATAPPATDAIALKVVPRKVSSSFWEGSLCVSTHLPFKPRHRY
jgi:hypothetical protein